MTKTQVMILGANPMIKREYSEIQKTITRLRRKRYLVEEEMYIELNELNFDEYYKLRDKFIVIVDNIKRLDTICNLMIRESIISFNVNELNNNILK